MADSRFFRNAGPFKLGELAELAGARLETESDSGFLVRDVSALADAGPGDISFLDNKRYLGALAASKAGACIVEPAYAERAPEGMALLIADKPYRAYAMIAGAIYPSETSDGSRHPTASIDPSATLGEGVEVGAFAVIGKEAQIGAGCLIGAHAVIGDRVRIGAGTHVGPCASLSHCDIGSRCQLHAGVRIGNRGFGFAMDAEGHLDVPQLGCVVVEDDVEIGANSTVDRGAGPDTTIGAGSKIDNLVQIGHNVRIGRGSVLVAQSGVAGSTQIGDFVALGAQAGISGHLTIGAGAQIGAQSGVMRDIPAGQKVVGAPAMPVREFFRLVALWQRQLRVKGKKDE